VSVHRKLLDSAVAGHCPATAELLDLSQSAPTGDLVAAAGAIRDRGHGSIITYSPKVFLPITHLCRDVCHYCTFARSPGKVGDPYMSVERAVEIASTGAAAGCREALFTLGDKPELRYPAAREWLAAAGHTTTLSYVADVAREIAKRTGLLPHINAGVMSPEELDALKRVSVSQGIMLESASLRLCRRGGPHFGSPDKNPRTRLAMIRHAGEQSVPLTTGLLIGIGESAAERVRGLVAIRAAHARFGHIQEIIIQAFRAKATTRMSNTPEPAREILTRTVALARIAFGPEMNIQTPPNLSPGDLGSLIAAGINDWGGISAVTPDFVNPEAPWPAVVDLEAQTAAAGKTLIPRLCLYPSYIRELPRWVESSMRPYVLRSCDGEGFARSDSWTCGVTTTPPKMAMTSCRTGSRSVDRVLSAAHTDRPLQEQEIELLLRARGSALTAVLTAADELRRKHVGDQVTYVVNRNINYTNVCQYHCTFCGFSKGRVRDFQHGRAYQVELEEIERRTREAWERGATEVCLQGGIHPSFTGATYLEICRAVRRAQPSIHIHAFSPLEVWHGAQTLGLTVSDFLERLIDAGLNSLPGTAAEILDDEVRSVICPDKVTTDQWLSILETAHRLGLRSTATIMFGHVERYVHVARHLIHVRRLQERTSGLTEFVPLPYVASESPMYLKGRSRPGPTYREALLIHAVARLALGHLVPNIQTSWVKMGPDGAAAALTAGANDLGGTLMNESITRSSGAQHGQELAPQTMMDLIERMGRVPQQRTTLYGKADYARCIASLNARPLDPLRVRGVRASTTP
jgi:FO synthase